MTSIYVLIALTVLLFAATATVRSRTVKSGSVGLVYRDGIFERQLDPGRHRLVDPLGRTEMHVVPTASAPSQSYQLSLMSKDQFSFRLSVVAVRRISDPRAYFEARPIVDAPASGARFIPADTFAFTTDRLQAELASGLVAWAGRQTLEEIIAFPSAGLAEQIPSLETALPGVTIEKLLVTELTVPPEVRKMFTEVERARREGLAQLERARSEQASLRALANAARALQSNPQLAQLRLLQTMEGAKGNKTFVLGSATLDAAAAPVPAD